MNLNDVTTNNAVNEIKKMKQFTDIVDDKTIKLYGNLKITKDDGTVVEFAYGKKIYVSGKNIHTVNSNAKADFRFAIKLISPSFEINKVKFDLSKISISKIPTLYIDTTKSYSHLNFSNC